MKGNGLKDDAEFHEVSSGFNGANAAPRTGIPRLGERLAAIKEGAGHLTTPL